MMNAPAPEVHQVQINALVFPGMASGFFWMVVSIGDGAPAGFKNSEWWRRASFYSKALAIIGFILFAISAAFVEFQG